MIRFDHVTKLYPGNSRPALNSVDLEILRGEFVFLVGASGSGKSSFLRLVLKEDKPSAGEIHVLGQKLNSISSRKVPYFRRNLGVVFQDFRLLPNKTVYANVAFTLQVIGKSKGYIQEAVPDVLKMVGLAGKENRMPHELSGGEQQRVAIARAVVNKPAILLADEPTGNLDPATSAGIMQVLAAINASGTTILMATHDVSIVDSMQRRVIELTGGEIIRDERGGGYQTTAVPIQDALSQVYAQPEPAVESQPIFLASPAESAPVSAPVPVTSSASLPPLVTETAAAAAAAPQAPATAPVFVAPPAPAPTPLVPVLPSWSINAPVEEIPEPVAEPEPLPEPEPEPAPEYVAPMTRPIGIIRTSELPEHLDFASKLGLRKPDEAPEETAAQKVGPTS